MGRPRLPEGDTKTNGQIAKDYRKRHSLKYNAYEKLRQEKRKLERLYKSKAFIVNEKDHLIKLNEEESSQPGIINPRCKLEEPMAEQRFKRSSSQLLLDILENINCMLDIKIFCWDGSFMWSRLLLSCISPSMNLILKQDEDIDCLIVDNGMKGKTVHDALINLLQVKPEWKEDYQGVYELFCVPITSNFVKSEKFEKNTEDFDLDYEELFQREESQVEDNIFSEQILPVYEGDKIKIERNVKENPEKGSNCTSQIDELKTEEKSTTSISLNENLDSKMKNGKKIQTKRKGRPPVADKDNIWFKDPSPDRFIDGKKVKYICVTQENLATGPPYHCIACNHKSNVLVNLKKHYRVHSNEKPFVCKVCGKKFSSSSAVSTHWNNRHNKNWVKEFSCDVCGLLFPEQNKLLRHRVVHSGEAFPCKVCGKQFDTPWKKERHEKGHNQESVACPICGKEFANKRNAENHQERHGDERNYECDICGQKSKTKRDLRIHKNNMHSDNQDCECAQCGRIFKRKNLLDQHMKRVHEKSTRFQCLLCPQVLSTKNHFKKHSLRCHDGNMIPPSNRIE